MRIPKNKIQRIKNYFKDQPVKKAYLFGSHSRNTASTNSDIDILVELDYSQPIGLKFIKMQLDLENILQIKVHDTLTKLYHNKILDRHQIRSEYLYVHPDLNEDQLSKRERELFNKQTKSQNAIPDSIAGHIRFLVSILTEQQSRLYLGFESLQFGHGGDVALSRITGVNVKTIARGRQELEQRVSSERIRSAGAGRPSIKKKLK
jgi:predicted nucleotidyltransferase